MKLKLTLLTKLLSPAVLALGLIGTVTTPSASAQTTTWAYLQNNTGLGGGSFNFNNGPLLAPWDDFFGSPGTLIFSANFNNGASYDNTADLGNSSSVQPWGLPNTATYGETIVDPTGATALDNFTFYVDGNVGETFLYQAFVMTWNGPAVGNGDGVDETGSTILYASGQVAFNGTGGNQAITATIAGGVGLTPGDVYEIGFTADEVAGQSGTGGLPPGGVNGVPDAASSLLLLSMSLSGIAAARRWFGKA